MHWTRSIIAGCAVSVCLWAAAGAAQSSANHGTRDEWWKHAVIYEVYPQSFQDSDGDGIGDIKGIASRLDYLHDLGIDAMWITPMYPSPGIDNGYDIADYTAIDPKYGTMADFDNLVAEAHKRNIRVIMDYVINHTSDQHRWFKESRSSRDNPKRDWYVWHDGKGETATDKGQPPNNWQSWFGHSAWQWDEKTRQYYYHYFYVQQPDLNWRNPQVHTAMMGVLDFWMKKGVSGFRIDAVSRLFEDPQMRDDPYMPGYNVYGDRNIKHKYTDDLPEVHDVLKEVRRVVGKYPGDPVLVTEADEPNVEALTKMYGNGDEVQLPMDFQIADVNELSAPRFRKLFDEIENNSAHGQPEYFFSNHDQPRQWDRYGDGGAHNDQIAKLMAVLELCTRGTPQMYYGEELGMRTTDPKRIEDVHDPIGKLGWPKEKGRDGERTPMQWDGTADAGFTKGKPWLPVPPSAKTYNVETESKDPNSIFSAYKKLLALRKTNEALRDGSQVDIDPTDPNVYAFLRRTEGKTVLVAMNMSGKPQKVKFDWASSGVRGTSVEALFESGEIGRGNGNVITMGPYAAMVEEIQ